MSETYVILGGGGSFGIQTAKYILETDSNAHVVAIGRNPLRSRAFSLDLNAHPRFSYHTYHLYYEMDLLLEVLDELRPDYLIN